MGSESNKLSPQENSVRRFSWGRLTVKLLAFFGLAGVGLYLLQIYSRPDVDLDRTKPLSISSTDIGTGNSGSNSNSDNSDQNSADTNSDSNVVESELPKGAVTARVNQKIIDQAEHPFDPLAEIAQLSLAEIDKNIQDYTTTLVSQVRVKGKLQDEKYVFCKIRHARSVGELEGKKDIPFSVYTLFLKPKANVGQEAIWVDGWHEGNLVAHTTGMMNLKIFYLDPDGTLAMDGNLHPIREIGFRNLMLKMAELTKNSQEHGECTVKLKRNVEVNGVKCTVFEVVHPVKRDHFENHIARIYIDDSENIPIAYEAYLWPEKEGGQPPLLEKYYYTDLKLNVGLTHDDFQADNKEYNYPKW